MTYPPRINRKGFGAGIADKPRVLKALENNDITTLYQLSKGCMHGSVRLNPFFFFRALAYVPAQIKFLNSNTSSNKSESPKNIFEIRSLKVIFEVEQ